MATSLASEVAEKYLFYTEFKEKLDKLSKEDRVILKPELDKLFRDWRNAVERQIAEAQKHHSPEPGQSVANTFN
jgi:hypothetical protein